MEEKTPLPEEETFAKIPRAWKFDRVDGKLSADEFVVLVWLALGANYYDGRVKTSYEEIVSDLSIKGKDPKNKVNKIMLSLKKKRRVWYHTQQGRRSSFMVEIGGYLLSTKSSKDINHRFNGDSSRSEEDLLHNHGRDKDEPSHDQSNTGVEIDDSKQKQEYDFSEEESEEPYKTELEHSRSTNNDNDNDNNKNNSSLSGLLRGSKINSSEQTAGSGVTEYVPKTGEERRCKIIAIWLGEKSMNFILSSLKKLDNDMTKIEEAYEDTRRAVSLKGDAVRRGRYFNKVLSEKMKDAKFD